MSLNLRIFVAYFSVLGIAIYFLLNAFTTEFKPGVRQASEDALLETSNLLAELIAVELQDQPLTDFDFADSAFARAVQQFEARRWEAEIYSVPKHQSTLRIYITDDKGIVRYDSNGADTGKDYSRWNDVYLTLRGQYGARTSKTDPDDELSTVMHVAAPIIRHTDVGDMTTADERIIGVVTVAKPNLTVQPFINLATDKLRLQGMMTAVVGLLLALGLSVWLTRSIRGLTRYAEAIRQGQTPEPPVPGETELARLAGAMEDMRQELEGKAYVETFVYELTHELKSPVSAIKGASEILQDQLSTPEAQHFLANIDTETQRIDEMVNRLLKLVSIEKQAVLDAPVDTDLQDVVQQVLRSKETQMQRQSLRADTTQLSAARVRGDVFLLAQAVDNLLQNAIDFSPPATKIQISTDRDATTVRLSICDQGPGIPDYAVHKVFNRFYSLPRPASGKKSTGLGLGFVRQIMRLHQGDVLLRPQPGGSGTCAVLSFPAISS